MPSYPRLLLYSVVDKNIGSGAVMTEKEEERGVL